LIGVTAELPRTFWALVERRAASSPDAVALEDEQGRTLTFEGFRAAAEAVAAGLSERGVRAGTVVSWQLPTAIDTEVLMVALTRLGAVQNPIVPIMREREVRMILQDAHPQLLIVRSQWRGFDYEAMARAVAPDVGAQVVVADTLPTADPSMLSPPPTEGRTRRWLYHTSGSTARPKGVWHSDASVLAGQHAFVAGLRPTEADVLPIPYPITHIGGMCMLGAALTCGYRQVLVEAFDTRRTPLFLAEREVTLLGSALPFFQAYLAAPREHGAERLYPKLRAGVSGGAPLPPAIHDEVKHELGGIGVINSYGLTEFPAATTATVDDPDAMIRATQGRAAPGVEIRVVGPDGSDRAPGEEGELRLRGRQLFSGYADPALDEDAFDEQGYFRTGDLGEMSSTGYVTVTGRLKDIIIRNAENISAIEIEDLLHTHPAIDDVAVIGVSDPRTGERVCAVVKLVDPGTPFSLHDIDTFCRDAQLAIQKIPERLELVDAIPRLALGKIDKVALRRMFDTQDSTNVSG
jgi:acyl-CoA synthetase (AMP-forming)/AMP-acid ligase II